MMSEHIAALVSTSESETLEFKATTGTRREATIMNGLRLPESGRRPGAVRGDTGRSCG